MRTRFRSMLSAGLLMAASAASAAEGRFIVRAPQVESGAWRDEARAMQDSGTLQALASMLNELFVLPRDVGLRYVECGEANAYYDADTHEIQMCLELMQDIAETLAEQYEDDAVVEAAAGAYIATALHEAGHALVHVLQIPVTGREEDAVDQLSAWLLIQSEDVDSVLGVAATYYNDEEVGDEDYGNEHSLDRQRYYNLVCWAYGSDPGHSQVLIDDWALPEERAEQCAAEYAQLDRSWSRLLRDHLRGDAAIGSQPATTSRAPRLPIEEGSPVRVHDGPIVGRIRDADDDTQERSSRYQPPGGD